MHSGALNCAQKTAQANQPTPLRERIKRFLVVALPALALFYLWITSFPGTYIAFDPTALDEGWKYALNFISGSAFVFGRDVVYTYGPLGYLTEPRAFDSTLTAGNLYVFAAHVLFGIALALHWRASQNKLLLLPFALGLSAMISLGPDFDYRLLLTLLLFCFLPSKLNKPAMFPGVACGLIVAILMFTKFNMGCAGIAIMVLASISWVLELGPAALRPVVATAVSLSASSALLLVVYLRSLQNAVLWIMGSIQIAAGYNDSMGIIDPHGPLMLALAILALAAAFTIVLLLRRHQVGYLLMVSMAGLLLSFKHSFVRQDAHQALFFAFLLINICALGFACRQAKSAWACALAFVVFGCLSFQPLTKDADIQLVKLRLIAVRAARNIQYLLNPESARRDIVEKTAANYKQYRLPDDFIAAIHSCGNPAVGTLPNCIGYCPANGLKWDPLPTVQLYNAYTPALDRMCADHYDSSSAPAFIVWGSVKYLDYAFGEIDHRNPILEAPLTALSLLRNYETVRHNEKPDVILLKHRAESQKITVTPTDSKTYKLKEWLFVPESNAPVLAYIKLERRPAATILSKLYQLPELNLECKSEDGLRTWRIVPDNLDSGLLISCYPRDTRELAELLSGKRSNKVQAIRLVGPACKFFKNDFRITWAEARLDAASISTRSVPARPAN